MEQLSLFDFFNAEKNDEITFTPDIQEELIRLMSQALIDVYRKGGDTYETDEKT